MIASQKIGESFMGALNYNLKKLTHPDPKQRAELLDTNFTSLDKEQIKQEVELLRQLRPNLNRYVYHTSLNFSKEDQLQNSQLLSIALQYLEANGFTIIPTKQENGKLLFSLSPNDLVYVPSQDDLDSPIINGKLFTANPKGRIYKFVSCTGGEGHFVHHAYAVGIVNNEQGTNNKSERMLDFKHLRAFFDEKGKPLMIKNVCWKVETNRLGHIVKIIK